MDLSESPLDEIHVNPVDVNLDPNGRIFAYQFTPKVAPLTSETITSAVSLVSQTSSSWSKEERSRDEHGIPVLSCNLNNEFGRYLSGLMAKTKSEAGDVSIQRINQHCGTCFVYRDVVRLFI